MDKSVVINFESFRKTEDILFGLQEFVKKEEILIKITASQNIEINEEIRFCFEKENKIENVNKMFGVDVEIID